jgi:hypothetical protein
MAFMPPAQDYAPPFKRTDYSPRGVESTIEDAVQGLEDLIRESFPALLDEISRERADGIILEPIRSFDWEEIHNATKVVPACIIIGDEEQEELTANIVYTAQVTIFIIATDRSKSNLTRKLFRYGQALKRMLRPAGARTLHRVIVSARIVRIQYSPTFVDRDQLFARDLRAEVICKLARPC